jgi:hypothetical protein
MRCVHFLSAPSNYCQDEVSISLSLSVVFTDQWYHLRRFGCQPVCQLFIVSDQISYVDIAVKVLQECVFSKLISRFPRQSCYRIREKNYANSPINEFVVDSELQDKLHKLFLDLAVGVFAASVRGTEDRDREDRLTIHLAVNERAYLKKKKVQQRWSCFDTMSGLEFRALKL